MRIMSRFMILAVAMYLFCFTKPVVAVTWEMAGPLPASNFLTKNLQDFADKVDKLTGGEFKLNLHVSGELIKPQETKQALRTGQIPIGQMYLYVYGNEDPVYETSALPFIAGDAEKAMKMWEITKPSMEEIMAKQRIKILYVVPWPIQGFYTQQPIASKDDLKDLKFRVYSTKTARMAELLGANPVQIQFGEIAQAFATGLVGAMYTSPQTGINTQAWDFAKYFTNTYGGNRAMTAIGVNMKAYQALTPKMQQALQDAALEAQTQGWETSEAISNQQIETLKEKGMIVEDPTPEFKESLDKIGQQMLEEWAKTSGPLGEEVLKEFSK
ncbi:MAG: TRAP transporter substrate-binding protein [Desulfobacterales bacterium]|nr:TRAP transporter substrate-binding protein [Desulfofustis sp.]MBT8360976.1 TRAP transporter substrate-binding protein [Deltaproteobacteria bacterium]NNK95875.1 TRAP transporter substrate-binding protein [Desulfobacterales bacterium]